MYAENKRSFYTAANVQPHTRAMMHGGKESDDD
jgi:hypothetical protein